MEVPRVIDVSALEGQEVTEKISDLKSMTKYDFTLFSVFENISSSGVHHSAFTGKKSFPLMQYKRCGTA